MEKLLVLALLLALLLTGCGGGDSSGRTENDVSGQKVTGQAATGQTAGDVAAQAQEDEWGLALAAEDVSPEGLTLRFVQRGGSPTGELETGSPFWLERETADGAWAEVEPLMEELAWDMMAYLIHRDGDTELEVKWSGLYGELEAGSYNLCLKIQGLPSANPFSLFKGFLYSEGSTNITYGLGYHNDHVDELIDEAAACLDAGRLAEIYTELQEISAVDFPNIPVLYSQEVVASSSQITGYQATVYGLTGFTQVCWAE